MFKIVKLAVTLFQQNSRILYCPKTKEAVLIDPGGEGEKIIAAVELNSLNLTQIWLTHSHLDHCGGVEEVLQAFPAKLFGHRGGADLRRQVVDSSRMFGIFDPTIKDCPEPDVYVEEGQELKFSEYSFKILCTPGHSPDSVCFYHSGSGCLLAGDTLFAGSIGRTDLPGGDSRLIIKSIKEKILSLPLDTAVLSGHGPDTTVGTEKHSNPFLAGEWR